MLFSCCLKSSYSLRTQLLLSFGISAFISLFVVVLLACVSSYSAGKTVQKHAETLMRGQVTRTLLGSSKLVAEKLNAYMLNLEGTVQLLVEGVQDRIVGYPEPGWESDEYVPFFDMDDELKSKYPLNMPPAPLDWNHTHNINESNAEEHLQERYAWFPRKDIHHSSTASATYFFQGICQPNDTDPSSLLYYPNCSEAHNDVTTGGVLRPTGENYPLWRKSGDIGVFLKPLYESQPDALSILVGFFNEGAGSLLVFPGQPLEGSSDPYTSSGCDWMSENNPRTGEPFADNETIALCHPAGSMVHQREYNPMEREWCQQFALSDSPHLQWHGPRLAKDNGIPIMTVGKAIFDRKTGAFIGCAAVVVGLTTLSKLLGDSLISENSILSLVNFDTGTVINDSINSVIKQNNESLHITDTNVIKAETFNAFKYAVNFSEGYSAEEIDAAYQSLVIGCLTGTTTAYPLPIPPEKYDPDYRPLFIIFNSIGDQVFDVVTHIEESINAGVLHIISISIALGFLGLALVLLIVWCVSRMLTQPLMWIEETAHRIINPADDLIEPETPATMHCSPKSEVNDLVNEFRYMIRHFSGSGAATVAETALQEIRNELTWRSDFQHLYVRSESFRCNGGTGGGAKPEESSDSVNSPQCSGGKTEGTGALTDEESHGGSGQGLGHQQPQLQSMVLQHSELPLSDTPVRGILQQSSFKSKIGTPQAIVPAPIKRNRNHVINHSAMDSLKATWASCVEGQPINYHRSRLFWLIVFLIVIPLLLTNAVICSIVSISIATIIPSWVDEAAVSSWRLEQYALNVTASSKAALISALVYETVRDLHLITRISGWLFFDALQRSDVFTELDSATEECKIYALDTCPVYENTSRTPCPCEWNELWSGRNCTASSNAMEARYLQHLFFSVESLDADNVTGFRNASPSFPELGSLPNTTQWWGIAEDMPGSWKAENASGFSTTYDRVRVGSAVSVAGFPVYNYRTALHRPRATTGLFLAFADDGLTTGFTGCTHKDGNVAFWSSSQENLAFQIAGNLCPVGKYGFDPRCRSWYAKGKNIYESSRIPVHITAPYPFAVEDTVATSATSPMADPQTGVYVGQVLIDFIQTEIRDALSKLDPRYFSILITPEVDATGGDTVVGPNKSAGWESAHITDLLFLHDGPGSPNRVYFEESILVSMKNGSTGLVEFKRSTEHSSEETLMMAFARIVERVLLPVNPKDFSRGVNVSHVLLYSVGVALDVESMHEPFHAVEDDMNSELETIRYVYIACTIVVSLLFTAVSCMITVYVTRPLITLLRAVQNINKRTFDDDIPPLLEGSREVYRVYTTFAKLYKVVRISNTAFFSGNLEFAYRIITNALALFRKVDDRKAVGIACNNLGNTLFAMLYEYKEDALDHGCTCNACLALPHYNEAVDIGQKDFDAAPGSALKADYALQLADRLFSRGLFLLVVDGERCAPLDAREQGYRDIMHARNLDYDVKDYWLEHKCLLKNSAPYFNRLIRRINGLAEFWDDIGLRDVWDVKELVDDADQLLFAAWNEPDAPLFQEVSRVGRLQQLEAAAIQLWHRMGNDDEAARLAMRMLSEDEYLLERPFVRAAEALNRVVRDSNSDIGLVLSKKTISSMRQDLRRMLKSCKNASMDVGKNVIFTMELSERWEGDPLLEQINMNCLKLFDRQCRQDDCIGIVAYGTGDSITVELGTKEDNIGRQRTLLDLATLSTTERANPAFPLAVQMLVDSQTSLDNDSYIILVMDGYAWDSEAASSIQSQIDRLNLERNTLIHLFIIGLDVEGDTAREQCQRLCSVSKSSFYADGTPSSLDGVFDLIASAMTGRPITNRSQIGITMEKF